MQIAKVDPNKIRMIVLAIMVILFTASALIEPLIVNRAKENWGNKSKEIAFKQSQLIQDAIDDKSTRLVSVAQKLKDNLTQLDEAKNLTPAQLFALITKKEFSFYSVQINNETFDLVAWSNETPAKNENLKTLIAYEGQTLFITNKLKNYLALLTSYKNVKQTLWILTALPISELSLPTKKNIDKRLLIDSLRIELNTDLNFIYGFDSKAKQDGRFYSSPILNNYKNKIAIASFPNPSLNQYLENQKKIVHAIQSILLLLFVTFISAGLISKTRKIKSNLLKFAILTAVILGNRVLLFLLDIPSGWFSNSLTDSSNFSSRFAGGMVRSPLEFFISVVTVLSIALIGYMQIINVYEGKQNVKRRNRFFEIGLVLFSVFLYLLLWRGFGAVIRSVIFDSTIRYFKEFALVPSEAVFLMCLNILILGFTIFLSSLALLVFANQKLSNLFDVKSRTRIIFFFASVQILGFAFDRIQAEPQGTDLIRAAFFTLSFIILYFLTVRNKEIVYRYFFYALASSIISVSLLAYYNSQLEKESLKNSAYDLVRVNDEQVQFVLYQTLLEAKDNSELINDLKENRDCSTTAFSIWMKSLIYRAGITAAVSIFSSEGERLGSFSSANEERLELDESFLNPNTDIKLIPQGSVFGEVKQIDGFVTIKFNGKVLGYLTISALVNSSKFSHESLIKILAPERVGILSAVDYENLNVYEFLNKELVRSSQGDKLSEYNSDKIFSASYDSFNEAWIEMEMAGEKHLVFLVKMKLSTGEKTLAVTRENKNFTWNLSDFFKIFFIHAVVISLVSIFYLFGMLKKEKCGFFSFRSKLITAFLLISIIPLFMIAAYIRNLTEERNYAALSKIMFDNVSQLNNYLEPYMLESDIDRNIIFEKAAKELNKNFSVYELNRIIYSSSPSLYKAGLFGSNLNPEAYQNLVLNKNSFYVVTKEVLGVKVNSAFGVLETSSLILIIEVNDLLNKTFLPLSETELDVFLFGVFAFAMIVIIIISTILAGQISSPIKKLTNATRAVSNGDLSVEVSVASKGELGELASGFNMMVQKIKQNQVEIAQFEREEAWREMAKQVAHEIKNPLTPMKLSVQQLVAAHSDKSPKFNSIFEKVTSTIISQIETLKNIASEFSSFARMPRASLGKLNAAEVVSEIIGLYTEQETRISCYFESKEIYVVADADHLKRTLVNVIRNAFQAKADKINVAIIKENMFCVIKIADNGIGISQDILPNIFENNFTTKITGMGLGLSMAKKYIESINGKIIVEKTDTSGSTFAIIIPLAQ
ncbi:MAG: integral membrane sensor signal transduction histidine kinase [Ignavibacteria bacterium]|nr:MAG: integral membrane sensor signal transduction histidine kinase [Ignavibacteria bacterium]KAF0159573.1 MAG: integral membrane sensor signal transduction histidine kinase [Ignavibacteria bacterium]